jgi:hypothetical protein
MKQNYLTRSELLQLPLSSELRNILVGLILGDLHIFKHPKGVNVNLYFEQGVVHEDYLLHLYDLFEIYCSSVPKTNSRFDKRTGKEYSRIRFQTRSLPCFGEFYNLFYYEGKKIIPRSLGDLLTPSGLAYFAMDDGTLTKDGSFYFCTDNFLVEDTKYFSSLLNTKFNLNTTLHRHGREGQYRISVPKSKFNELVALIGPHIHSSMQYKINSRASSS